MRNTAELLRGIAAVLWPVALVIAIILFRTQVRNLINRIRRARFPGGEIELDELLDDLKATTEVLEEAPSPIPSMKAYASDDRADDEPFTTILETAANSPRAGLMLVSAELDAAMRRLLAAVGHYPERPIGIQRMARELNRVVGLPVEWAKAFEQFTEIRNAIVHGQPNVSDEEVLRALDLGLTLLGLTQTWPHERNIVLGAGLEVYSDSDGKNRRPDVTAVLLGVEGSDTSVAFGRPFPTTLSHFRPGQRVSWEWNITRTWDESWYRHPDGDIRYGWRSSAEFVGRPLEEL